MQVNDTGGRLSESAPLIDASALGKCYRIYQRPLDRLWDMLPWFSFKVSYQSFWALRDVDFRLKRGDSVGIIGRNGAGKSTFLQLISGILTPTEGKVSTRARIAALLELGAGFNPDFTGRENIFLNASIYGLSHRQINDRLQNIIDFSGIEAFIDQPVKAYSSGMYLRLAFSVIAHVDADILIVDEALAVGDALFSQKCLRFLREFRTKGALLLVSHDLPAVNSLCERAIWLEQGQIKSQGDAKVVVEQYLESIYAEQQQVQEVAIAAPANSKPVEVAVSNWAEDARKAFLEQSQLRNEIFVPPFMPDTHGFGTGLAVIERVTLLDHEGATKSWLTGGESVVLEIAFHAKADIAQIIVGFLFKDRYGQVLFGDNSFLQYCDNMPDMQRGEQCVARFHFRIPYLPTGNHSISVGVASGTQQTHVQHHWVHEALAFESMGSHVTHGLMGIPMEKIDLDIHPPITE